MNALTNEAGRKRSAGNTSGQIRFAIGDSSLGVVLVAGSARGVCALFMGNDRGALEHELRERFPDAGPAEDDAEFAAMLSRAIESVEDPSRDPGLPLDERGTEFQLRVWRALREIPPGRTATYTEIAKRIGLANGARAVARACATNPLAVITPCHRVVRSDGGLAGYRWGKERKKSLLERERPASTIGVETAQPMPAERPNSKGKSKGV